MIIRLCDYHSDLLLMCTI